MATLKTGLRVLDASSGNQLDLGTKYVTKEYLLDVYPNIVGGGKVPGLFTFGRNDSGQLGNGNSTHYSSPIQIGSLTNWKQFAGGANSVRFIKTDGTLWAWGNNLEGQLGNNTNTNSFSSPIQIGSLTNWKQVSYIHAIKTDGTLWGWGRNVNGQLGNNNRTSYSSPIQIGSLTNWKQLSTGGSSFMLAIKTDGTLWGCGYNGTGNLGNGTSSDYSSPIQIGSLSNWKQVSAGGTNSVAVKTDGTLWAWGNNFQGQLGINSNSNFYSSPIQIGSLTNWKMVSAANASCLAIKTDGTLWGWGDNGYGELGNNNRTQYSSPIQIGSLTNWKSVSCGYTSAAVKTDGTLWAWGSNQYGQLGIGNTTYYSSPIQIGSLTTWKQVSGGISIVAIKDGYI
jgi:alpha-tubulin suppressor-like RCC1 family protein